MSPNASQGSEGFDGVGDASHAAVQELGSDLRDKRDYRQRRKKKDQSAVDHGAMAPTYHPVAPTMAALMR